MKRIIHFISFLLFLKGVFCLSDNFFDVLDTSLENLINESVKSKEETFAEEYRTFSVNPFEHFEMTENRFRRSTCAGSGVGNLGFNSFNFLTFMVLTFNAIANTNNNINNNNNNDNNINLNSISQDSNSATSNSDNTNTVMVMILPPPVGKRALKDFSDSLQDCNRTLDIGNLVASEFLDILMSSQQESSHCNAYHVCRKMKVIQDRLDLTETLVLFDESLFLSSISCEARFPECLKIM